MSVMYVGPTILGVATRNTTYPAIPDSITAAAKPAPYLASLCVPTKEIPKAMEQIRKKEGAYWTFYNMAKGYQPSQT